MVGEILLIPQNKPGILAGDSLTYDDLLSEKKRTKLVMDLLAILEGIGN